MREAVRKHVQDVHALAIHTAHRKLTELLPADWNTESDKAGQQKLRYAGSVQPLAGMVPFFVWH
jgi:hypothetical protein